MNANNLKNIGIIMGGYSHEHEISLKSGMVVYNTHLKNITTVIEYLSKKIAGL